MIERYLPLAIHILVIFYLVAGAYAIATGDNPALISVDAPDFGDGTIDTIIGIVLTLFNALSALLTAPIGVITLISTGITTLDIIIQSIGYIAVIFAYIVVFGTIKNLINPLH